MGHIGPGAWGKLDQRSFRDCEVSIWAGQKNTAEHLRQKDGDPSSPGEGLFGVGLLTEHKSVSLGQKLCVRDQQQVGQGHRAWPVLGSSRRRCQAVPDLGVRSASPSM